MEPPSSPGSCLSELAEPARNVKKEEPVKARPRRRWHPCSICGKAYFSGKALGGHQRKHRLMKQIHQPQHTALKEANLAVANIVPCHRLNQMLGRMFGALHHSNHTSSSNHLMPVPALHQLDANPTHHLYPPIKKILPFTDLNHSVKHLVPYLGSKTPYLKGKGLMLSHDDYGNCCNREANLLDVLGAHPDLVNQAGFNGDHGTGEGINHSKLDLSLRL